MGPTDILSSVDVTATVLRALPGLTSPAILPQALLGWRSGMGQAARPCPATPGSWPPRSSQSPLNSDSN